MTQKIFCLLAIGGFWTSSINAQWQAVPSPADRAFAFVQSGARIFAGSLDSGLWLSTNGGASFAVYPTGLAEMNFDIRGFETRRDTLWAAVYGGGVCRSIDGGVTWSSFNAGFETQPFAVGVKQIGDTVYAAVDYLDGLQASGVYKTSIKQAAWKRSGSGFPTELRNVTSFAATPSGAMLVGATLAGARGNAHVSMDGGQTWQNRNINGVQGIITLEADSDTIYAGTTDGIYVTRNNAESWQRLGAQFQNATVDDILIFNRTLFAAVDGVGVAYSPDGGASWNIITGNLPIDNDFVSALFFHGGKLFAGLSAAHGIWSRPLPTVGVDEDRGKLRGFMLAQNYPNPFPGGAQARATTSGGTAITFTLHKAERVTLQIYDTLGREVATLINNERKELGSHTAILPAQNLASGVYFYRLTAGSLSETRKMLLSR